MLGFFGRKRRVQPRRCRPGLEVLEDRTAPATITLTGAGRFQDGMVASLVYTGGNNYTAINLRSAIVGANNLAGPDTILLENGTYTMNDGAARAFGQFAVSDLSGTLTIANGAGGVSTIDAQGQSRAFLNQSGLTLSGLKIENGLASDRGGAIFNNGTLNINNCQFVNNEALGGLDGSPVQGGAIFDYTGRALIVQNSTFAGNIAQGGTSSVILRGTASAAGGAIFFAGDAILFGGSAPVSDTILASTFVSNQAVGGAGAVILGFGSRGGDGAGGGIFAEAGSYNLNVINSTFAANVAKGGPGALDDGGNAAGGGIYLQGGGINVLTGTTRLVNDTIALNRAMGGQGSGVLAASGIGSGGGLADGFLSLPAPKVINTIVAKNAANQNKDVDGVFSSLGSNLIGTVTAAGAGFGAGSGDFVGSAAAPLDPGLDPLGNYGGPTQTFRLSAGSFAADRGNSVVATGPLALTTDQRGQPRRSGSAVDIGAYEATAKDQNKSYTLAQGTTLTTTAATTGLLAGYNNPLGKTVTVQLVAGSGPAAGKLTLNPNGSFTYKPLSGFHGAVSFRFEVLINGLESDTFTVIVNVTKTSGRLTL
jgi:hypothetical protein